MVILNGLTIRELSNIKASLATDKELNEDDREELLYLFDTDTPVNLLSVCLDDYSFSTLCKTLRRQDLNDLSNSLNTRAVILPD
jgi:hypothetical protein